MIFIFTKPNGWLTFYRFYRSSNDHFDCIDLATPTATKETPKVKDGFCCKKKNGSFSHCVSIILISFDFFLVNTSTGIWKDDKFMNSCVYLMMHESYIHPLSRCQLVSSQASPTSVPHSKMLLIAVPNERNPHRKRWKLDQQKKHMEKHSDLNVWFRDFRYLSFYLYRNFKYIIYILYIISEFWTSQNVCLIKFHS